jgi:hypothetical protein
MHAPYVASSFFDYVSFAKNINGADAWGTSLQYFSAGAITQTDNSGFDQGSFTPYDMAASAGYAHRFDSFSVGASAKYVRSVLLTSAQTAALDLGVVSAPLCHDRLRLSGVVTNMGGKLKFDQESDRLPLAYRAGAAYQVNQRWLASADIVFPIDNSPLCGGGQRISLADRPRLDHGRSRRIQFSERQRSEWIFGPLVWHGHELSEHFD